MQVMFTTWAIDPHSRWLITLDPFRVDATERYQDEVRDADKYKIQIAIWWGEAGHDRIPACTKIIMKSKQVYLVQGSVVEVNDRLKGILSIEEICQGLEIQARLRSQENDEAGVLLEASDDIKTKVAGL